MERAYPVVERPALPKAQAWREVMLTVGVLWLVLGLGCFCFGVQWVYNTWGITLDGAFALSIIFFFGVLIVIAYVYAQQHRQAESLMELGWSRPCRLPVLIIAIIYGVLWAATAYTRGGNPLELSWQRLIMMLIGLVLAFGEEIAVRGLILDRLDRCGTNRLIQVLFTGLIMGMYHGILGFHISGIAIISATILFSILSIIYVYGGRSLIPVYVAHALTHFLGDPELMKAILYAVQFSS